MNKKNEWLKFIRKQEIIETRQFFPKNKKILEIGGKDGYLASILHDWGFDVKSIDLFPVNEFFDVKKMDATNLEFKSNSFEIIFSSQVVAHIENKEQLFSEIKRTLMKDGIVIHIVPSRFWVILTSFWHYILVPKILFSKRSSFTNKKSVKENVMDKSKKSRLLNLIFLHPLGTDKSFLHEMMNFSKKKWSQLFFKNGFEIINTKNSPLVYSGHSLFLNKGIKIRHVFSAVFPSSYIFVMKKMK